MSVNGLNEGQGWDKVKVMREREREREIGREWRKKRERELEH